MHIALFARANINGSSNKKSHISLKFEDGITLKLKNIGENECGNCGSIYVEFTDYLDKLKRKKVKSIRYSLANGETDLEFIYPHFFIDRIPCLE